MRSAWTRAAAVALATAAVSALPLLNGCKTDVEKADEKVSADLDSATIAMSSLRPEIAREAAVSITNAKGTSPDTQIEGHLAAAQADLQAAELLMSGPGPSDASALAFRAALDGKAPAESTAQTLTPDERTSLQGIEQRQMRIAELLTEMTSIGGQLTLNNINIAGYKALDPVDVRQKLQKATTDVQKGDNGVWVPGTAPLASLDALKTREQDLQKQIADLTSQRNDLSTKRGQALEQAGKFSQQADSSTGTASVGFFTQASNQRKEAADDEVKIGQFDSQIAPLQQDLNLVQAQEKALTAIVAGYTDQMQQIENSWGEMQRRIEQGSGLSKDLLEKPESPVAPVPAASSATPDAPAVSIPPMPHSLAGLATELDAQVKEVQSLRAKALALLDSAFKHYDQALGVANTLTKTLTAQSTSPDASKLPEKRAWQERIALYSPAAFKLQQAAVETALGRLYCDEYVELAQRNRVAAMLSAAIKQGGLSMPPALATALSADVAMPPEVDSETKGVEGDLRSEQPPFEKDAKSLNDLSATQTSPMAQQAIAAAQADVAYHWSANLLKDVAGNAGQSDIAPLLVNIAHAALMANYYAQAQFALLQKKDQEGSADMSAALDERKALVDANAQNLLPAELPPELAFEVKPTAAPSTSAPAPTTFPAPSAATPTTEGAAPTTPAATSPAEPTTPATTAPATPTPTTPENTTQPTSAPAAGTTPQ